MAGRKRFSNLLLDEWRKIPDDAEHKEEREKLLNAILRARDQEFKMMKEKKALTKAKVKAKNQEPKVASLNPSVQDYLDKIKGDSK